MNLNKDAINELQYLLNIDTNKNRPKYLLKKDNEPTKKALEWNLRMLKEGKTFQYLDKSKVFNPKTGKLTNFKFDKRFKKQTPIKQFKNVVQNINTFKTFETKSKDSYEIQLRKNIDKAQKDILEKSKDVSLEKYQSEGEKFGKSVATSIDVEVDLTKINFKDALNIIKQKLYVPIDKNVIIEKDNNTHNFSQFINVVAKPKGGNSWITLSNSNISRLEQYENLSGDNYTERAGSDNEFIIDLVKSPIYIFRYSLRTHKNKPQGAFFRFYVDKKLDITEKNPKTKREQSIFLKKLDLYTDKYAVKDNQKYRHNCFHIALKTLGICDEKLNTFKDLVKCGEIPLCKLNQICQLLKIKISLRKEGNKTVNYGVEGKEYKIGLLDNHFFAIIDTPFSSYCLKNFEEIKDIKDFNKIYKKSNGKYKKSNNRNIDSFTFVKLLLENKDTLLKNIPINEMMDSQYYKDMEDNDNLEYDMNECLDINQISKNDNSNLTIVFFDFETNTKTENHTPYLMCSLYNNNEYVSYGADCGKNFINYLSNEFSSKLIEERQKDEKGIENEIMLIAHNARYDYTFLLDYMYNKQPILKGNHLMGGSAIIYTGKTHKYYNKETKKNENVRGYIKIVFQDSLNLVASPLKKFGKMFHLKQSKEILPYDLYTTENIDKGLIPKEECLNFVKDDDKKEYIENMEKWDCIKKDENNEYYDIIKYSYEYCKIDCLVLKDGYNTFRKWIDEITGLDIKNYCSLASLSLDYLIKEGCFGTPKITKYEDLSKDAKIHYKDIKREEQIENLTNGENVLKMCGVVRRFIQKSVVGGRVMTARNMMWKIENSIINDHDAVSLYPSSMKRMKGFLKGTPKVITNKNISNLKNYDGFFIKVICLNNPKIKRDFPLLSVYEDSGIRNFTNETKGKIFYLDKVGYEDAVKYQGLEFKIINGYYFDNGHNNKINSVIQHLFNQRVQKKKEGNPIQAVYKLLMNSSYGKCLLKPIENDIQIISKNNWDKFLDKNYNFIRDFTELKDEMIVKTTKCINKHYNNVHCGVEILSMSKRIMNEVICLGEDIGLKIYYQDTDSIHINDEDIKKLINAFEKEHNRKLIGTDMGQFHSDFEIDGKNCKNVVAKKSIFLGKKSYYDYLEGDEDNKKVNGDHIRMKGIPNSSIKLYAKEKNISIFELYNQLYDNKTLPNGDKFDLLCGGKNCKFQYNKDMTVSSVSEFERSVNFTLPKAVM